VRGSGSPEWVAGGDTPAQYGKGRRRTALGHGKMGPPGIGEAVVCTTENERARREIVAEGGALRRLLTDEERGKGVLAWCVTRRRKRGGYRRRGDVLRGTAAALGRWVRAAPAHITLEHGKGGGPVWGAHLWASPG
jgi:hypothetical protein